MPRSELSYIGLPEIVRPSQQDVFSVDNHGTFQHPERVAIFGALPDPIASKHPHLRLIKPED